MSQLDTVKTKHKMAKKMRENLVGYSFIIIWIIGFLIFMLYPFINSIIYSLNKVSIQGDGIKMEFIGIDNFKNIVQLDAGFTFLENLWEFIQEMILQVPVIIVFSIIIAVLLNQPIKCRGIFRVIFFLPVIISSGPVINELISQGAGGTNIMSDYGFVSMIEGILSPSLAKPLVKLFSEIIIVFWFSGVQILIMLAGLQKINRQVYEAARVDGAGPWEIFWKITLPSLKSLIFINVIYTIVLLASFSENEVIVSIKRSMFDMQTGYGFASAMAWVYMLVIAAFIGITCLLLMPRDTVKKAKPKKKGGVR